MIVIVDMLVRQILWDLVDRFEEIGMPTSPLTIKEALKTFTSEFDILNDNKYLFMDSADYFKDSMECFFVLCRQKEKRTFDETTFNEILQLIERIRYSISTTIEIFRMSEHNKELKHTLKRKQEEAEFKSSKNLDYLKTYKQGQKEEKIKYPEETPEKTLENRLHELYKRKICRIKPSTPSRESKVDLKEKTQKGL